MQIKALIVWLKQHISVYKKSWNHWNILKGEGKKKKKNAHSMLDVLFLHPLVNRT